MCIIHIVCMGIENLLNKIQAVSFFQALFCYDEIEAVLILMFSE